MAPQGAAPDGAEGVTGRIFPDLDDDPDLDLAGLPPSAGSACTTAGAVCLAMKAAGIADTAPGSPKLKALLDAGADLQEFVGAAQQAKAAGSPRFSYALGIVAGERKRAAEMAGQLQRGELASSRRGTGQTSARQDLIAGGAAAIFEGATHV